MMQTFNRTLTLCLALVGLASCVAPSPDGCAGWKVISTNRAETIDYLAANDPQFLRGVIGHAETGSARGCW
ncbi:MAG: hypothetical protein U5N55_11970 [Cypionkella sp.]|nr:hypothetical protein [Cypionkella sp.]MDZ7906406.1 hypothetical protein [Cypionkella sp.]